MKITYTQHVSDPALRGTTTNLPAHIAQVLVATGQAFACEIPRRGTNAYLKMRAEEEAGRQPGIFDTCVANVYPPVWECIQLPRTNKPCILYRAGSEVTRFESLHWYDNDSNRHDALPKECPASIRKQFEGLLAATSSEAIDAANERALQERLKAEQHEKTRSGRMLAKLGLTR
jgi:hypothetical protein